MRNAARATEIGELSGNVQSRTFAVFAVLLLVLLASCATLQSVPGTEGQAAAEEAVVGPEAPAPADVAGVEPVAAEEAVAPVRLQIPEIGIDAAVTTMGWHVATIDGQRTTSWDVPLDSLGWHSNSAGAGASGNTVVSGRQADGDAVLAGMALGSVVPGQEVRLTDENGRVFVYTIREVSEPIPVSGATEEEKARALAYLASGESAILTLITGWPEFTTTHRLFAVADLVGVSDQE